MLLNYLPIGEILFDWIFLMFRLVCEASTILRCFIVEGGACNISLYREFLFEKSPLTASAKIEKFSWFSFPLRVSGSWCIYLGLTFPSFIIIRSLFFWLSTGLRMVSISSLMLIMSTPQETSFWWHEKSSSCFLSNGGAGIGSSFTNGAIGFDLTAFFPFILFTIRSFPNFFWSWAFK